MQQNVRCMFSLCIIIYICANIHFAGVDVKFSASSASCHSDIGLMIDSRQGHSGNGEIFGYKEDRG